jgi:uncharacterized protein YeaO (DUF488 family)
MLFWIGRRSPVPGSSISDVRREMARAVSNIHLKRIYDPPGKDDGARVLVDRLWPRGIRKEAAKLTVWLKEIAPSPELREWFGHDPARFHEFSRRYRAELAANGDAVEAINELLERGTITLLYAAHDTTHNQAVVLADFLRTHRRSHRD